MNYATVDKLEEELAETFDRGLALKPGSDEQIANAEHYVQVFDMINTIYEAQKILNYHQAINIVNQDAIDSWGQEYEPEAETRARRKRSGLE